MEELSDKKFDIALSGFSLTHSRFLKLDFSLPLASSSVRMFYARKQEKSPLYVYFGSCLRATW